MRLSFCNCECKDLLSISDRQPQWIYDDVNDKAMKNAIKKFYTVNYFWNYLSKKLLYVTKTFQVLWFSTKELVDSYKNVFNEKLLTECVFVLFSLFLSFRTQNGRLSDPVFLAKSVENMSFSAIASFNYCLVFQQDIKSIHSGVRGLFFLYLKFYSSSRNISFLKVYYHLRTLWRLG